MSELSVVSPEDADRVRGSLCINVCCDLREEGEAAPVVGVSSTPGSFIEWLRVSARREVSAEDVDGTIRTVYNLRCRCRREEGQGSLCRVPHLLCAHTVLLGHSSSSLGCLW